MKKITLAIYFLLHQIISPAAWAVVPSLDVSGKDGRDGYPGDGYSTRSQSAGYGNGRHGRPGGHAGESSPGRDAGAIQVVLEEKEMVQGQPQTAIVEMDARFLTPEGGREQQKVQFGTQDAGFIYLKARGGNGGHGGQGGDGEGGQNGQDGSNATEYSNADDGDNGGNGGDGGNGTWGSNGGNGGRIEVKFKTEDTHLSLLVNADVSGGSGGNGGRNGDGGQAGSGGSGGSSYSWTTQVYEGDDCTSTTNADGTTSQSCTPRYRTDSHYRPSGSSGSSGRNGSSGYGNVAPGSAGRDGQFSFLVEGKDGSLQRYSRPFNVQVKSYKVIDQNSDGITEPDETITIQDIEVENTSEMPWVNEKAEFLVFLQNSGWVMAEPTTLKVPSLKSKQKVVLKGQLKFKIKKTDSYGVDKRLTENDQIVPTNLVTRVNRTQSGFSLVKPLTITFPLEITPMISKSSVGAGEVSKITWKIKNISSKPLGAKSENLRQILQTIRIKSEHEQDVQWSGKGQSFQNLSSTQLMEIAMLEPGESVLVEGEVKFADSSLPYTERDLQAELQLGQINSPQQAKKIQVQSFKFKISQLYNYNKDADWVLVVNQKTQREEFLAWNRLAQEFGIKMDVWDMSYYGRLMLSKAMTAPATDGKSANSFAENYKGKTVIVVNNSLDSSEKPYPVDHLSQEDVIESMVAGGLNVVFIGPEKQSMGVYEKYLVDNSVPSSFKNLNELLQEVEKESQQKKFGLLGSTENRTWSMFGAPSEEKLKSKASKIAKRLLKSQPHERFIISYGVDTTKLGWGRYGSKIKIQKTFSPGMGKLVVLNIDENTLHQKDFIQSAQNIYTVLEGMNYDRKLRMFSGMGNMNSPWSAFIADTLIRELVSEQDFAFAMAGQGLKYPFRVAKSVLTGKSLNNGWDQKYQNLMNLNSDRKLKPETRAGSELLRVIAAMKFYSTKLLSWSGQFSPVTMMIHRRDMSRLEVKVIMANFPEDKPAAQSTVTKHQAAFEQAYKERMKSMKGPSKLQQAQDLLKKPNQGSSYSSESLFKDENKVRNR